MRVWVTGGSGFLGSILMPKLTQCPDIEQVINFDARFFGEYNKPHGKYLSIQTRVETIDWQRWLQEFKPNRVIWLAALSNDPSCELNPPITKIINHFSAINLALLCKQQGIPFIFASSCSVYGAVDYPAREYSPLFPISLYAKEKAECERDLWSMADDSWQPVIFRMATLYGSSPRMRFDLAINLMVKDAVTTQEIHVYGGSQWRPFLYVEHAAEMFREALFLTRWGGRIENAGDFNTTILELASFIADNLGVKVIEHPGALDSRNYRIEGAHSLSDYSDRLTRHIAEIANQVRLLDTFDGDVNDDIYYTVKQLKKVL